MRVCQFRHVRTGSGQSEFRHHYAVIAGPVSNPAAARGAVSEL